MGEADSGAKRNPAWTRDELLLALDLYVSSAGNPRKDGSEIAELSSTLNRIGSALAGRDQRFRNANGVYMKVMNFRRFDPIYLAAGKKGLTRGNRLEEEVWNRFAYDVAKLQATAAAIRAQVALDNAIQLSEDELIREAEEGRLLTREHISRERNRTLARDKKLQVLRETGKLACEACGFDFAMAYGERGQGFIEVHHTVPLHTLGQATKTRINELALLCANCHRMVHYKSPWLTVAELKVMLERA